MDLEKKIINGIGHYHRWGIYDSCDLVAVVTVSPEDGRAFKVVFIETTLTGCSFIIDYIKRESKDGGFKE